MKIAAENNYCSVTEQFLDGPIFFLDQLYVYIITHI